ncbi:MAG: DUF2007 domain-containing protein [Chthoniobacteraceae bacterium]
MTTVASFHSPEDAHLLRMRLEAAGIPAFLQGENIASLRANYLTDDGGVRVQIADEDVEAARKHLLENPEH